MQYARAGLLVAVLAHLSLAGTSTLSDTVPATPEIAVTQLFAAMQSGNWARLAKLIHPAAIEKQYKRDRDKLATGSESILSSYGLRSADQFVALSATEAFELRVAQLATLESDLVDRLSLDSVDILGKVTEGEVVHVVMRTNSEDEGHVTVLSCRPFEGGWLVDFLW